MASKGITILILFIAGMIAAVLVEWRYLLNGVFRKKHKRILKKKDQLKKS